MRKLKPVVFESNFKRLPEKKSGRLLAIVRDNIIDEVTEKLNTDEKFTIDDDLRTTVIKLNKRIKWRLDREDSKKDPHQNQLNMFTDEKTKLEYMDKGVRVCATFNGTIEDAKASLVHLRRIESVKEPVPVFLWAHYTRGNESLIRGMWSKMEVVAHQQPHIRTRITNLL